MSEAALRELSRLLAHLRRTGIQQSGLDARLVPRDNDAAYMVAAQVAGDLGWPVGGWKIAAIKEEQPEWLRNERNLRAETQREEARIKAEKAEKAERPKRAKA